MAMVKRSEVKNATSRVVLASMESVMAKGDSEAHGDWCWDIVINTVRCETRKVDMGVEGNFAHGVGGEKGAVQSSERERDFAMSNCTTLQSSERSKERARNS